MNKKTVGIVMASILSAFVLMGATQWMQQRRNTGELMTQPMDFYNGAKIDLSSGSWMVEGYGGSKPAVGFDVNDTSSGGNLVIHLINTPSTTLCTLKVAASSGITQTKGIVFDRIDSLGTTATLVDGMKIWF